MDDILRLSSSATCRQKSRCFLAQLLQCTTARVQEPKQPSECEEREKNFHVGKILPPQKNSPHVTTLGIVSVDSFRRIFSEEKCAKICERRGLGEKSPCFLLEIFRLNIPGGRTGHLPCYRKRHIGSGKRIFPARITGIAPLFYDAISGRWYEMLFRFHPSPGTVPQALNRKPSP